MNSLSMGSVAEKAFFDENIPTLPPETQRVVDLIAHGVSLCFMRHLLGATQDLNLANSEAERDKLLKAIVERAPLHKLGIRKDLIIHLPPGSVTRADRRTIPMKLNILPQGGDVCNMVLSGFASALTYAVVSQVIGDVTAAGPAIQNTLARQRRLHQQRHEIKPDENCCLFRMLDEDFIMIPGEAANEIMAFGFQCTNCPFRHRIKVYCRSEGL